MSDFSEDEELVFAFEDGEAFSPRLHSGGSSVFHSIDGVAFERPANPMAAVLERQARKRGLEDEQEPEDEEEKIPAELKPSRKRKSYDLPVVAVTNVVRPTPKRMRSDAYERSVTAPPCLTGVARVAWEPQEMPELERDSCPRSASINIPHNKFQPIHWPGDAAVSRSSGRDRSHSCSSSSSSKSWSSLGLFCRRSLDVSSPLRVRFSDLVLNTASRAGSYTGS